MRKLTILTAFAFVLAAYTHSAMADQLTIGQQTSLTPVTFCSGGSDTLYLQLNSCTFPDSGQGGVVDTQTYITPNGIVGTMAFTFPVITISGLSNGGGFTTLINNNGGTAATFTDTNTPTDSVSGVVNWKSVSDGTTAPKFVGTFTTSSSGTGVLGGSSFFPYAGNYHIDMTFLLNGGAGGDCLQTDIHNNCTEYTNSLENLSSETAGTALTGAISSGEIPGVPEVSSILLLGTGLLSAGTFVRLRRRRQS